MGERVTCRFFAEYHQFYLLDEEVRPSIPTEATDGDFTARLLVRPNLVVVLTFQPNLVAVAVEVAAAEPPLDLGAWDHIAECDLELPSGRLVVDRCVGPSPPGCLSHRGRTGCGSAWAASATGRTCRRARMRPSGIRYRCGPGVPGRW
jgi:hypothetical protein